MRNLTRREALKLAAGVAGAGALAVGSAPSLRAGEVYLPLVSGILPEPDITAQVLAPAALSCPHGVCVPWQNEEYNDGYNDFVLAYDQLGKWYEEGHYKPYWYDYKHDAKPWVNTGDVGKMYIPMQYILDDGQSNYASFVDKLEDNPTKIVLIGNEPEDTGGGGYLSAANFVANMNDLVQTLGFVPNWVGPNCKWTTDGQNYVTYLKNNLPTAQRPVAWGWHVYLLQYGLPLYQVQSTYFNMLGAVRTFMVNLGLSDPHIWVTEAGPGVIFPESWSEEDIYWTSRYILYAINNKMGSVDWLDKVFWFASNGQTPYSPWGNQACLMEPTYTNGRSMLGDWWKTSFFGSWIDDVRA